MVYEHRTAPLLPRAAFRRRLARHGGYAAGFLLASLAAGTAGFHWLAQQDWLDALLTAAMLLGGMGPVGQIQSSGGKLFAAAYALYAGLAFIGAATILLAPIVHRLLHRFHLEESRHRGGSG